MGHIETVPKLPNGQGFPFLVLVKFKELERELFSMCTDLITHLI